ncbi:DUF4411 family protein [Petrocella sp. FN5]|uniref:DUF4411 family protein n=1 Tax=Petrocella sp. FN5 TaxID=3032002 RepID=UPI0023DA3A14|nr:DUF4411 family protein [Petrocella sp. FN5]MDF1618600.1 DUF4411 family protein [Petrocella sp. FN5]
MQYLLDTNIFIQAKNIEYPFDVFPGFWDWLDRDLTAKSISSIKPIYTEIENGNDELAEWIKTYNNNDYFLPVDDVTTQEKFAEIANWVYAPDRIYKDTAKDEFLSVADSWLVAKAAAHGFIIVTQERYDANCKKKILIPNVCEVFGVRWIDTIELLRKMNVKFGMI